MGYQYSDGDLIRILKETAGELDRTPTQTWMNENGEVTAKTCENRFGSWNKALSAAGLELNQRKDITDEELLDMLREAADELGHAPGREWARGNIDIGTTTFRNRFGSWNEAIRAAGLKPERRRGIPKSEIVYELMAAGMVLDATPSLTWWRKNGPFSERPIVEHFGSWNNALEAAGFQRNPPPPSTKDNGHGVIPFGDNWLKQREVALDRDDYRCRVCGLSRDEHRERYRTDLHVHHLTPRVEFFDEGMLDEQSANDLPNLITLCAPHHREFEAIPVRPQITHDA